MQAQQVKIQQCLSYPQGQKIVSLPLEFAYLPVDILSKQFTKLNSPHTYRIHYLGPRFTNTQGMHKKMAYTQSSLSNMAVPNRSVPKYSCLDPKKVVNSFFINEKLRNNHFYKAGIYYRAFEGMNPSLDINNQYVFNGAFESANLDCVIKFKKLEFDLFLRIDSNTRGHLQWFYFSVQNNSLMDKIKLNICNISKPGSFYESGMQPYFFSKKAFERRAQNWTQGDSRISNVIFQQKPFNYQQVLEEKIPNNNPYCYSFEYQFQFENDQVYFAYCIPYTYSQMMYDIDRLSPQICKIHKFSRSLTGVDIPLLHISDHQVKEPKKSMLITGRIHPAQSNSSHVLKGFMDFLCSDHKLAKDLRKKVNFYIIPMINPDGVILGNSRSGASGRDLNRMFIQTDQELFPQIFNLKLFTTKMNKRIPFLVYLDFHGHSRKKNTFFYGPSYSLTHPNYYKCRVLPKMIEKCNNSFRYWSCLFAISESKKATGRAFMFQNVLIPFTYTVESSIGYYYDCEKLKIFSFNQEAWRQVGSAICQGTSNFMIAYEEYESFLIERRAIREKKKFEKIALSKKSMSRGSNKGGQEDEYEQYKPQSPLKIKYKDRQQCFFMKILQEIKKNPEKVQSGKDNDLKKMDDQLSSDDHDEKEDFEISKLKQFNNLIIQNAKKDKIIPKFTEPDQTKSFVRNDKSKIDFSAHQKNFVFQEELDLFQEIKKKPSSSQGFRKKVVSNVGSEKQRRTSTGFINPRNRIKSQSKKEVEQKKQKQEKEYRSLGTRKNQITGNSFEEDWKAQEVIRISGRFPAKDLCRRKYYQFIDEHSVNSSRVENNYLVKNSITPSQKSHYSQIQFPDEQVYQNKNLFKHCKTDLFRRNIERKKQKIDQIRNSNMKSFEKQFKRQISGKQIPNQAKSNHLIQFKIQDLITNLQFRSKVIKDSVKFKNEKKVKIRNNSMFPSSFYGVKQHTDSKRNPSIAHDEPNGGLTIKPFYAK